MEREAAYNRRLPDRHWDQPRRGRVYGARRSSIICPSNAERQQVFLLRTIFILLIFAITDPARARREFHSAYARARMRYETSFGSRVIGAGKEAEAQLMHSTG